MTTRAIDRIDATLASQYRTEGYLVVRQVFPADRIAALDAEAHRLRERADLIDVDNIRCRWQNEVNTGECRFDCFDPVIDLSPACERTARDPRLLDIVGTLYGEPACLSPRDGMYHQLPEDAVDLSTGVVLDLAPGDIAIFSGYTPHRSGANHSTRWRRLLYLSYNAVSEGGEQRDRHYAEFHTWLRDRYAEYGKTLTFFR
jgi:hypothetical protein